MKYRLLEFYRQKIPHAVKEAIPEALSANVAGWIYRFYPHPDLAFYHARYLSRTGQGHKAAKKYMPMNSGAISDPLFNCRFEVVDNTPNVPVSSGRYNVEFCYAGIKIIGRVQDESMQSVDILLDNHLLRSQRLIFKNGIAKVQFVIKRDTLERFNTNSILSLRVPDGRYLAVKGRGTHINLHIPHGGGGVFEDIALTGTLDKKGKFRESERETSERHQAYLSLYERANRFFKREFHMPLMLVCGTLLGQHRNGDFIPGDDDFDVGYVSKMTDPLAIKSEAITIINKMVESGFTILLNREGKPFRISDATSGLGIHLDVTPIFTRNDGHVWMHKLARLDMDILDMRNTEVVDFLGTKVEKPMGAETYLAKTYGNNWRNPDPNFSYADWTTPAYVMKGLRATCIGMAQQCHLKELMKQSAGQFIPIGQQPLYPIALKHIEAVE